MTNKLGKLTPIQTHAGFKVKRDDLFSVAGVGGGKARTCFALSRGAKGLITAGSRQSPQVNIVAHIARLLGVPCRVHVPSGALTPELESAKAAGAKLVRHTPGYNTVIVSRAKADARRRGWTEIPFGMECEEAVKQTSAQISNLPPGIRRLVVPVGSGMSLAGILSGLADSKRKIKVLGIVVGASPIDRLERFAPKGWRKMVTLRSSRLDYHQLAAETALGELELDPIYEAKCLPYLKAGDLLWVVGIRQTWEKSNQKKAAAASSHRSEAMEDFVKSIMSKASALDEEKRKAVAAALRKAADELDKAGKTDEEKAADEEEKKAADEEKAAASDEEKAAASEEEKAAAEEEEKADREDTNKSCGGWPADLAN